MLKTDTENLTVNDIVQIVRNNMDIHNLPVVNTDFNIKNYIYNTAETLCNQPVLDEIYIENKIVFAAGIRLKAEDYMISKLKQVMSYMISIISITVSHQIRLLHSQRNLKNDALQLTTYSYLLKR